MCPPSAALTWRKRLVPLYQQRAPPTPPPKGAVGRTRVSHIRQGLTVLVEKERGGAEEGGNVPSQKLVNPAGAMIHVGR